MKIEVEKELMILLGNYPELTDCKDSIVNAFDLMRACYKGGGLIMTCGNGGSAADASHIVGELMKAFKCKRPLSKEQCKRLISEYPQDGAMMAEKLQQAVPALALTDQVALNTAFLNDVSSDMIFAQQVFGYGKTGDVLIGISTSGNSLDVVNACKVAKAFGMHPIALTGEQGGKLLGICDVTISVPASETYRVQEYHLPVYHSLCAMLECELWG
jgi:D-sedoheptulose 7-phosphate isomerase